jgi:hypothetical protein
MTFPCHAAFGSSGASAVSLLSRTQRASNYATNSAANLVSSSFTPSNNSLLVAIVQGLTNLSGSYTPALSGGSLAWTRRVNKIQKDSNSNAYCYAEIWTAPVTTGASMQVTLANSQSQEFIGLYIVEYTGANASPAGVSGTWSGAGWTTVTPSITLPGAPLATSQVVAALAANTYPPTTSIAGFNGSGWTEILGQQINNYDAREVEVRSNSTSTAVAWAGSIRVYSSAAVALEIRSA